MPILPTFSPSAKQAVIQLSFETLSKCIKSGFLSIQDFHCLDASTKHFVWQMLLNQCEQAVFSQEVKDAALPEPLVAIKKSNC